MHDIHTLSCTAAMELSTSSAVAFPSTGSGALPFGKAADVVGGTGITGAASAPVKASAAGGGGARASNVATAPAAGGDWFENMLANMRDRQLKMMKSPPDNQDAYERLINDIEKKLSEFCSPHRADMMRMETVSRIIPIFKGKKLDWLKEHGKENSPPEVDMKKRTWEELFQIVFESNLF